MKQICLALMVTMLAFAQPSEAQSRFESLIRGPFANPFTAPVADVETNLQILQPQLRQSLETLVREELALEQSRSTIESHGYTATSLFLEIRRLSNAGDFQQLNDLIVNGRDQANTFFKNLDGFIQDYLDVTMALGYHAMRAKIVHARKNGATVKSLKRDYAYLEKLKDRYLENKHQYQQPKDTFRTTPYKTFFQVLQKMTAKAEAAKVGGPGFWSSVRKITQTVLAHLRLVPSAIRFARVIFSPKQPSSEGTPMATALQDMVGRIAVQRGLTVHLEGEENLPNDRDPRTINIFAASHRDAINDQIAIAGLKQETMIYFGAPYNFLPNVLNRVFGLKDRLIKRLNDNLGFVVVGKGASPAPLDKALKIVRETPARNFLIFPGGRLPEGLGATMGVREKTFGDEGLVALFESHGYKVNLIPISMKNNARLFDDKTTLSEVDESDLEVRVHQIIDHDTRQVIMQYGGKEALNVLLRFGLTEALTTNQDLVWGQVRVGKIIPTLDRYLGVADASAFVGQGAACRDLFKSGH